MGRAPAALLCHAEYGLEASGKEVNSPLPAWFPTELPLHGGLLP